MARRMSMRALPPSNDAAYYGARSDEAAALQNARGFSLRQSPQSWVLPLALGGRFRTPWRARPRVTAGLPVSYRDRRLKARPLRWRLVKRVPAWSRSQTEKDKM